MNAIAGNGLVDFLQQRSGRINNYAVNGKFPVDKAAVANPVKSLRTGESCPVVDGRE